MSDTFSSIAEVLGGGYTSYMGGGGGQYPNQIPQMTAPGSRMSVQQPTLPGMIPGQMRMLGNQQNVPMHIIKQYLARGRRV